MIFALQILAGLVAHYLGRHDGPACDQFSNYGSSTEQQKLFHDTNWKAKFNIIVMAEFALIGCPWLLMGLFALVLTFIMWPTFNISLNLVRRIPERPWDYISTGSNWTDKLLTHWFGKNAGRWLLYIAIFVVIAVNVLMYILYGKSHPNCFGLVQVH